MRFYNQVKSNHKFMIIDWCIWYDKKYYNFKYPSQWGKIHKILNYNSYNK